jgi:hypothetical protein
MQHGYKTILKVEIVLKQLEEVVEVARRVVLSFAVHF